MATPADVLSSCGAKPADGSARGRLLLVDDERGLLDLYSEVLAEEGYEVTCASDGATALQALQRGAFDAVLTDVVMPGCDGIAVLRAARDRDPHLPVVLLTGNPSVQTAVAALELRAVHYLLKPLGVAELVRCVSQLVQLRRQARESSPTARLDWPHAEQERLQALFARALDGLRMAYQPIVRARDGAPFAWEALLRSSVPELAGAPAFIALAEKLGRLPELGRSIRDEVARSLDRAHGVVVFVNLHPDDLLDERLYDRSAPLSAFASTIVLEITERASIEGIPDIRDRVSRLRDLGFRIAVDDLGSGYAGLTSYALLEPDFVKIDRALVQGMNDDPTKRRLVGAIVSASRDMGIAVIAEGVELERERETAVALGCELVQGYLLGRPECRPLRELAQEGPADVGTAPAAIAELVCCAS